MGILYSWSIRRSGAGMSIEHSCGKITGVEKVRPRKGKIIASKNGKHFELHVPEKD